ncbi:MAG: M12 family metallopeptidase [Planctomycetota bacterium]
MQRTLASLVLVAAVTVAVPAPAMAQTLAPEVAARPSAGCRLQRGVHDPGTAQARLLADRTWPGGTVPFVYDATVTPAMQASMALAMQEISSRVRVTFAPRAAEVDHVVIRDATINSSPIGRQGGAQQLLIANWNQRFEMVHALLHVLGFWHEHQRPDRDTFVAVDFQVVDPLRAVEFQVVPIGQTYGLAYDLDSVLHFGGTEGALGGAQAITVLPPNQAQQATIGQRTQLSPGDVEALRRTYGSLLPPTITALTPSSVPGFRMPPVLIDGTLMDEVTQVLLRGAPVSFQHVSPTQLRLPSLLLPALGPATIAVVSGAGPSAPAILQITGTDPPVLEGPPVLNTSLPFPFRIYSDATRLNLLVGALDNVPSSLPGVVSLGLGSQFTTLFEITAGVGNASGQWTVNLQGPRGLAPGQQIWLQSVVYDPLQFTLPLASSNVLMVRVF